jgi:hypothetical protein
MERLNPTLRSLEASHEGVASLSSGVVFPTVPFWEANQVRKSQESQEERRRLRLARRVVALALDALGDRERERIEHETSLAAESHLKVWRRRASYASTWDELVGARPIEGLELVSCERLLQHAIDDPLECWCVLLLFTPSRNEEMDYDRVRYGAPWVREAGPTLAGVVDELREHRRALVTCRSERIARGLAATVAERRLWARVYGPSGRGER